MTGYTRQALALIQPGLTINAEPFNTEFDAVQAAFENTTGHDHSGLFPGDGAKIVLTTSVSGILPVLNGGTGVTTKTGTGSVVLNTSPSLITPAMTAPVITSGASITGTTVVTGAFNATTSVSDNSTRVISKSNPFAVLNINCTNPAGTTDTSGKMAGVNKTITPVTTGRLLITFTGSMHNDTNADGSSVLIRYGTGTPPANGDSGVSGTAGTVNSVAYNNPAGTTLIVPFSITALVVGLTLNTAYWLDLAQASSVGGGTTTLTGITLIATEI